MPDDIHEELVNKLIDLIKIPNSDPRTAIIAALAETGEIAAARVQAYDNDLLHAFDDKPNVTIPLSTTMNDVVFSATLLISRNEEGDLHDFEMRSQFGYMAFDPPALEEFTRGGLYAWGRELLRDIIVQAREQMSKDWSIPRSEWEPV
jgi:hypothetical protein